MAAINLSNYKHLDDEPRPDWCDIINGVEVHHGNGSASWASDWTELHRLAYAGHPRLSIREGGPGTMGHVDVMVSPR